MRLSVFSPESSQQLVIDLQKLYQCYFSEDQLTAEALEKLISTPNKLFFVTLFNARHLGAVQVSIRQDHAHLSLLCVRDVTRRRGVGKNLIHEVEQQLKNKQVTNIQLSLTEIKESEQVGLTQFMQRCGYQLKEKTLSKNL